MVSLVFKVNSITGLILFKTRSSSLGFLKKNMRNFQKLNMICLKILFFMFFANFIFVDLHLKIHPAVHLNTSKALTSL